MTVDVGPDRAARAAEALSAGDVQVEEEGEGVYRVRSFTRARSYRVQVNGEVSCTCPDAVFNGTRVCKHALAVVMATGLAE